MARLRMISALVPVLFVVVFMLGCEGDHTAPEPSEYQPDDPVDWDGTKDGVPSIPAVSDGPSWSWTMEGFERHEHTVGPELRPHDHTLIVEAIIHNVADIAAVLPENQVASPSEVLGAALRVPGINSYTKSRIRIVLDILPVLEQAQHQIPAETQQAMSEVLDELEGCQTIPEMTQALQSMIESGQYEAFEGLPQGLESGIGILRDGQRTIYAPRLLFNLKRMIHQDLAGAIGGAIGGAIVGAVGGAGVGAAPGAAVGALAGAAGASGADAFGQLTGWW